MSSVLVDPYRFGVALSPYDAAVLGDSPAVYWKLADPVGTTSPVVDSSVNNRPGGVLSGVGVTFGSTGLVTGDAQTSATFANSTPSRVVRSYESWMNVNAWTLEAIVKPSTVSGTQGFMGIDDNGTAIKFRIQMNGSAVEAIWKEGGSTRTMASASGVMVAGTKKHVMWTYNQGGSAFLYVNGTQVATSTQTTGTMPTGTVPDLFVGSLSNANPVNNGQIARFTVFTSQLAGSVAVARTTLMG